MSENQPKQSRLGPVAGVGRRIQVAGFVIVALVAGLGYGYAKPAASAPVAHTSHGATTSPVNTAEVICPVVKDSADTNVGVFTPTTVTASGTGSATVSQLSQLGGTGKPKTILTVGKPGALVGTAQSLNGGVTGSVDELSDPVVARVTGPNAPGFTVTESTVPGPQVESGAASENCGSPDTDFWFTGLGGSKSEFSLLNMVDADSIPASVNVTVYSGNGQLAGNGATALQGLTITAGSQVQELISNIAQNQTAPYVVHVVATVGRVAAAVVDYDSDGAGRDFIGSQKAATSLVMPGIPQAEDNEKIELSLLSPNAPATIVLRWVGQSTIVPATGTFSGVLEQGKVASVDLSSVANAGEYAALAVCGSASATNQCLPVTGSNGPIDIVGEVKIAQSDSSGKDVAYITPVSALSGDGVVAHNLTSSVLTLTNTGSSAATVKVTQTPNSKSPAPVTNTYTVKPGATLGQSLTMPKGATDYALTVTPVSGTVYAARIGGSGHQLTIQSLSTAAETVTIPTVDQDVSGLVPQN
ncbi:DUF5719 family protein [Actinospica robiniae]|uniref:DUF5719 family protein n=1 Tax=Actinospica robiniae TaxID=304901 RepID=UPI0003F74567|nr:DUF5719 family protein [Actinospica robiniae]